MITRRSLLGTLTTLGLATRWGLVQDPGKSPGLVASKPTEWTWDWQPSPHEVAAPQVEICSLLHDKEWAYAVEIDDGPTSTLTVAQPLLARFGFTDAPPGVAGGRSRPFVGGAAVMLQWVGTANGTHLNWEQLRELERLGWGILNHSYWHTGNHWDPAQALQPADFRRELYWSRAILAGSGRDGRSDVHFVHPNGDFHFAPFLGEFGIRSASRVGGSCRTLQADPSAFLDLDRNWLDEGPWSKSGDPMQGFPKQGPKRGDLVIDFTHEIEADPSSKNQRRWVERLSTIASRFGKEGADTVWSAPTTTLIDYTLAARAATAEVKRGRLTVRIPARAPGSPLTIKLSGLDERSILEAPPGGSLDRRKDQAWVTTPPLGRPPLAPPEPHLERIYQGPVQDVPLDPPRSISGVRLLQEGEVTSLKIALIGPDGTRRPLFSTDQRALKPQWGTWLLYPTVPDRPAILAKGVEVAFDGALRRLEIWAEASSGQPAGR